MGMIEIEIGELIKDAKLTPLGTEVLMRKMALIIERQALALKGITWQHQTLEAAKTMDEQLFNEIKDLRAQTIKPSNEEKPSNV